MDTSRPRAAAWLRLARTCHRRLLHPLAAFLLPTDCFRCGAPLGALQRHGACAGCWACLRPLAGPLCPTCGLPAARGTDLVGPARGRCAACVIAPPAADLVRAALAYDEVARAFLLRAKLSARTELFEPFADQLARVLRASGIDRGCTLVVGAPSHPWARLRRGFEPGFELARRVARRLGIPHARRVLRRSVRAPIALKRLGARQRRRSLPAGAIRARRALAGERILLVDDVMTSGATVESCTRALKLAGAREVRAAVWARTPPPGDGPV